MKTETEHIVYQGLLLKFYHYLGKNGNGNRNSKHGKMEMETETTHM